jgi:hypothetical protein
MNAYAKSFVAGGAVSLLICAALAAPAHMHSPKHLRGGRALRQNDPEAVFVPITPCRAFDGQQLNEGIARRFTISGPTGACNLPESATAVTISLTTTASSGNGSVSAYPYQKPSSTRALTFHSDSDETVPVTVGLAGDAIALRANGSSTRIAGDVTGYYAQQIEAYITSGGGIYSQTARILSATRNSTGTYTIVVDRDLDECAAQVTPLYGQGAGYTSGNTVVVNNYDSAGAAADIEFNVSVLC